MVKQCILNKKGYALLFGVFFGCVALWSFTAHANVCFLPSMDCADENDTYGLGGADAATDDCAGYNLSEEKTGGGWNCDECGGKYRCQCSVYGYEPVGSNCIKVAGSCADSLYTQSNSKDSPWSCTECDDQNSRNYGKYKCECYDIMHNGECVEDPCESSKYDYSASEANAMKEKGYTCDKCNYSYSDSYGEYDCKCPEGKEVDDDDNCVDIKNCTQNGMHNTREACENARDGATNKKCVEVNGGECYKIDDNCDGKSLFDTEEDCQTAEDGTIYNCSKDTETRCYKRDVWNNSDICNATYYPYVKPTSLEAKEYGVTDWSGNNIVSKYLKNLNSVYVAHTDHLEGNFEDEIYSRIATDAKECRDANGRYRYDKICEGTPEDRCDTSKNRIFTSNGCVSSGGTVHYDGQNNYRLRGATWGTCKINCSSLGSGYYNTAGECNSATNKECFHEDGCYITCESAGYYSNKNECENGVSNSCMQVNQVCYAKATCKVTTTGRSSYCCSNSTYTGCLTWGVYLQNSSGTAVYDTEVQPGYYKVCVYRQTATPGNGASHYITISSISFNGQSFNTSSMTSVGNGACTTNTYRLTAGQTLTVGATVGEHVCTGVGARKWTQ